MADSKIHDLLDAIKAKVEAVTGITAANVQIGEITGLDSRAAADYPCVEIFILGERGVGYSSQRDIEEEITFRVCLHQHKATVDRDSGADMTSLIDLTTDIRAKLYGIHDDASPPMTGFLQLKGEFNIEYFYELVSDNINTSLITFTVLGDTADTEV